jgi:hypothetical protein
MAASFFANFFAAFLNALRSSLVGRAKSLVLDLLTDSAAIPGDWLVRSSSAASHVFRTNRNPNEYCSHLAVDWLNQ